jgi:hypothetical protein
MLVEWEWRFRVRWLTKGVLLLLALGLMLSMNNCSRKPAPPTSCVEDPSLSPTKSSMVSINSYVWLASLTGATPLAAMGSDNRLRPVTIPNGVDRSAKGPLRVLATNPRYFTDGDGAATFLAGSHTWQNLTDKGTSNPPPPFNYNGFLQFMVMHNFNFMRLWVWMLSNDGPLDQAENCTGRPFIWARPGPGTANDGSPKWDLAQLNESYFDRMRARVIQAGNNGIYVSIMLFNGWEWEFATNSVDGNPFSIGNNINSVDCPQTCPTDKSRIPAAAWRFEQAYIGKVIDTVNDLDNVLYEVSNEAGSPYSDSWHASVIDYVKQYESTKPKQHPIGMTFQHRGGNDETLYKSQADWVSPGERLPPDANGNKVILNDTDHSYHYTRMQSDGQSGQIAWAWENFTHGINLAFMDPYLVAWPGRNTPSSGKLDPYWNEIRNALTDIRSYAVKIDLAHVTPHDSLSTTGYCLADPGSQYLVFQPRSNTALTLTMVAGTYSYEWFNASSHVISTTGSITVGVTQTFRAPFSGEAALYLKVR